MSAMPNVEAVPPSGTSRRAVALPRGRRSTELAMLGFAIGIVAFAYAAVGLGLNGHVPSGLVVYVGGFAVLMLAAHAAVRKFAPWADPLMLPLAALLNGLGIVMIYRLQQSGRGNNPGLQISTLTSHAALYQLVWTAVGMVAFVGVLVVIRQPRILQRYTYTLGTIGLILLAIPALLPASHSSRSTAPRSGSSSAASPSSQASSPGSRSRSSSPATWSPSATCCRWQEGVSSASTCRAAATSARSSCSGPSAMLILIFESDIGTSALFFGLFVAMLYIATQRKSWLLIGLLLFVAGALFAAWIIPHVHERFVIWRHPFAPGSIQGSSFQLVQGLEGMAFGGIFGTGLGQGQPFRTPLVQSDFIFTGFGEELGLTGLMALLLIFGLLVQRGLRAALAVRDPFAKLLAAGLAFVLALQVFIIVGGVTQLIPLTGITTPFLSQGGSSLVASWIVIALLMRISDTARRPAPQPIQDEGLTQVVRAV